MENTLPISVFNPKSNKFLKYNSPGFKKLIRDDNYTFVNNALVPPNTTDFAFSTVQNHWINRNSAMYLKNQNNYSIVNQIIVPIDNGTVMGIKKRRISMQCTAYRKLLNIGYTLDAERKALIYPINIESIAPVEDNHFPRELISLVRSNRYSHLVIRLGEETRTIDVRDRRYRDIRNEWYSNFYERYTDQTVLQIDLYESSPVYVAFGPSFEGDKNCLISSIENHFKQYNYPLTDLDDMYEDYKDGVFESDIDDISKKLKMKIVVYVGKKEIIYGGKRNTRSQLKLFYHNNHVQSTIIENKDKENIFIEDLSFLNTGVNIDDITNVIIGKNNIYMISTNLINYRLKIENGIDLEKAECYSATSYYTKQFIKKNPFMRNIVKNHDNIDAIRSIILNGIMFSSNPSAGICIDLKGAYSNFKDFKSYTGFPSDLSSCVETKNMEQYEIIKIVNECEGFALISCWSIFDSNAPWKEKDPPIKTEVNLEKYDMDLTSDDQELFSDDDDQEDEITIEPKPFIPKKRIKIKRWVSFPYLRHRMSLDIDNDIDIQYLMIGSNRINLNLKMFDNVENITFHKVLGKMINHSINNSFTTTDPIISMNYKGSLIHTDSSQQKLFICNNYKENINSNYYPHITGYIHQYTEIEIEKKYLQLLKEDIPVYRIWVDGIVVPANTKVINSDIWHIKDANKIDYMTALKYITGVPPVKSAESFNNILTNLYTEKDTEIPYKYCITGEAGTGKTYSIKKLYSQMNNCIILVYTCALERNYLNENSDNILEKFPGYKVDTLQGFVANPCNSSNYETIIVDEYSMIGTKLFEKIPFFDQKKIIVAGDLGQLKCIKDSPLNTDLFKTITLTKNYRQAADPKFLSNLQKTRLTGDLSWIKQKISLENALKLNYTILCATHLEIERINVIGHALNPSP